MIRTCYRRIRLAILFAALAPLLTACVQNPFFREPQAPSCKAQGCFAPDFKKDVAASFPVGTREDVLIDWLYEQGFGIAAPKGAHLRQAEYHDVRAFLFCEPETWTVDWRTDGDGRLEKVEGTYSGLGCIGP